MFNTHPVLSSLYEDEWGYATLTKKIVQQQGQVVDKWIPEVKRKVREALKKNRRALDALGAPPTTVRDRRIELTKLASAVEKKLDNLICARDTRVPELNVSARSREFAEEAWDAIKVPNWLSVQYGQDIAPLVKEALGYSMSNFVSDPIFRGELSKHLWEKGTVEKADGTDEEVDGTVEKALTGLNDSIHKMMTQTFNSLVDSTEIAHHWEKLADLVKDAWNDKLQEARRELDLINERMMRCEHSQTFTINHYYEMTLKKVKEQAKYILDNSDMVQKHAWPSGDEDEDDDDDEDEDDDEDDDEDEDEDEEREANSSKAPSETSALEKDLGLDEGFILRYARDTDKAENTGVIELQLSLL